MQQSIQNFIDDNIFQYNTPVISEIDIKADNSEHKFYVYLHKTADGNIPFYIGKGCNHRAWKFTKRNNWWNNIVKKHGIIVEILQGNIIESEAYLLEKILIELYKSMGHTLCNIGEGGIASVGVKGKKKPDGFGKKVSDRLVGKPKSAEHRASMSLAMTGRSSPMKGKSQNLSIEQRTTLSETTKLLWKTDRYRNAVISSLKKLVGDKNSFFGKHHTEETKEINRQSKLGKYKGENNPNFGKRHTENSLRLMREAATGKQYSDASKLKMSIGQVTRLRPQGYPAVKSPEGLVYTFSNATVFCKEHNLSQSNINRLVNGKCQIYKGWTLAGDIT